MTNGLFFDHPTSPHYFKLHLRGSQAATDIYEMAWSEVVSKSVDNMRD
jgi:hypothetical protein